MSQPPEKPSHPGAFIRERVIPQGVSVTEAAKRLGVGRPALSNLLNGKSSLSPGMAAVLEKAFGADGRRLLDHQAAFDRRQRSGDTKAIAVRAYVPGFLTIEARQIHDWTEDNLDARRLLPVLLRKLVHSTGDDLRQVDFPGYDNAERKGWDGWLEAGAATPWIPQGKSGWEFGVNQDPRRKAEHDHTARLASVSSPSERAECTFVFVTPRNWPGKTKWAKDKWATGGWKDVRAIDASDLEQWLEQSIPAQIWLAEQLDQPSGGFETLDACWRRWAGASDPEMTPAMFQPSITAHRDTFGKWLEGSSERPFLVAADSRDEALAFLACLFQEDGIAARWQDLPAVFESTEALHKLAASTAPFLPIVHTDSAERELATVYRQRHCIAVRPRNAVDSEPDIALDLLDHDAFERALADMDVEGNEVERLARESGRSPTILRRRLSNIPAIRTPEWAKDEGIARGLIPMALIGAWHDKSNADREVLSFWGNGGYERIEEDIARLLQLDDAPVWSIGQYRGVASKIDALFAIGRYVTGKDLDDFFLLAEYVLAETDPALDLPEDERWAAGIYGKIRNHSAVLRNGICETLVILAVHGNHLFRVRLGTDVEGRVSSLVRKLLTPLTLDKLLSHDKDLPNYAEAAPDEFLRLIEEDLQRTQPVVLGLLKPVESGVFGTCLRSGLLWALECLAWRRLGRVSAILAQLSRTAIDDNWTNNPINSLAAIYRSWMPQTAASVDERMQSLETLTNRFPDIGWQICIAQWDPSPQIAIPSHLPRWRSDASGAGRRATPEEYHEFRYKALDLVLAWPEHDEKTLGDLVERVHAIPDEAQVKVWNLIDEWAESEINDKAKASLRERIRRFALSRWSRRRDLDGSTKDRAHTAYEKLQPGDPVVRHAWLFVSPWIDFSSDDLEDAEFDHEKHEARIHQLRIEAMKEIWEECGFEGVKALLSRESILGVTGSSMAFCITDTRARVDFLRECLSVAGNIEREMDGCIKWFLRSFGDEEHRAILSATLKDADAARIVRLLRCAPFGQDTWRLLGQYDGEIRDRYWREVVPEWNRQSEAELNELIDHLLDAKRPRAAFGVVRLAWPKIETRRLKRLLMAITTEDAEPFGYLQPYFISTALESLDGRAGVTRDEMAQFEFMFLGALHRSKHGAPNLERHIAENPMSFVQALAFVFRRNDGREDPSGWHVENPERRAGLASAAYNLFDRISHIPGTGTEGEIHTEALCAWVVEVRRLCTEYGRAELGDQYIGQLLSRAPAGKEDVWPHPSICEAMERIASPQISRGFNIGVYNRRGVTTRAMGEGGVQERELASKYRRWAEQHAFDHPYVSGILEGIATDYDRQAMWEDDRANVDRRLWH